MEVSPVHFSRLIHRSKYWSFVWINPEEKLFTSILSSVMLSAPLYFARIDSSAPGSKPHKTLYWGLGNCIQHCSRCWPYSTTWGPSQYQDAVLPVYGSPRLKIRRSRHRFIFNMEIPIPGKGGIYTDTGPRCQYIYRYIIPWYVCTGPPDLVKSRICEIGCYDDRIALKFCRHPDSAAAKVSVNFRDEKSLNLGA